MATEILQKTGTPKVWAHAADWPGGGAHGFGDDDYELDLTALATTKARMGAKGDLGAMRAAEYAVIIGLEGGGTPPAAGAAANVYWSASNSGTAATGNAGGASGSDGAYQDGSETEWVKQLTLVGTFTATNDGAGTVQIQEVGRFRPPTRYGMPVVHSLLGQTLDGDATNMFVALVPIVDEAQTA